MSSERAKLRNNFFYSSQAQSFNSLPRTEQKRRREAWLEEHGLELTRLGEAARQSLVHFNDPNSTVRTARKLFNDKLLANHSLLYSLVIRTPNLRLRYEHSLSDDGAFKDLMENLAVLAEG